MGFLQIYRDAIQEKQKKIIELQKEIATKDKEINELKRIVRDSNNEE